MIYDNRPINQEPYRGDCSTGVSKDTKSWDSTNDMWQPLLALWSSAFRVFQAPRPSNVIADSRCSWGRRLSCCRRFGCFRRRPRGRRRLRCLLYCASPSCSTYQRSPLRQKQIFLRIHYPLKYSLRGKYEADRRLTRLQAHCQYCRLQCCC